MPSTPAAADGSDRWIGTLDDAGALAIVWGFAIVVATPAFDYLLYGPGTTFGVAPPVGLALALLAVAAVAVGEFGDRLDPLLSPEAAGRPDGAETESVWDEVLLFGFTVFPLAIVMTPSAEFVAAGTVPMTLGIVTHHALLIGGPLCLLGLRRRGHLSYPSWARPATWGLADYAALFGATFVLCWIVFASNYGYSLVLPVLAGLAFGTAAVVLRRLGALVPDDEENDGEQEDARATSAETAETADAEPVRERESAPPE